MSWWELHGGSYPERSVPRYPQDSKPGIVYPMNSAIGPSEPQEDTPLTPMGEVRRRLQEQCEKAKMEPMGPGLNQAGPYDPVNPTHYKLHPSGVECIEISEHFSSNLGQAIQYIWRAGIKSPDAITDLEKAVWYTKREINRLKRQQPIYGLGSNSETPRPGSSR